ncbi:cation:proton antiporter [Streptomyces sp. BPTC-684]|uniref:cation:proton antiporter n=1 Tax=Streptomyces sp. BPTC-684 TaxID=3043734 RepID=UPI0024B05478|nr:cation:proton antiporter [Streptomyces sp. BPTC-684]WHM35819.1 cation:proton antiporter [Streptomyces sp. BPTC-684]
MQTHLLLAGSTAPPTGRFLLALAVILTVAFVLARLAQRVRQPAVMGEIVGGILLGPSLLSLFPGELETRLVPPATLPYLQLLSQLGLVLFMFGVGYQFDIGHLRTPTAKRQVAAVSLSSVALPFALGAGLAYGLYPWLSKSELKTDGPLGPALFLGAAMSITAFPVLARILAERGLYKDPLGSISLACAAVQDFLAWCILAAVVVVVRASGPWPLARMALESALLLAALVLLVRPGLGWLLAPARPWAGGTALTHAVLVVGVLLTAVATDEIGLHAVFGAFAFGAVVPRARIDETAPQVPERIEQTSLLLLPVFFTVTGMSVDVSGLGGRGLAMTAAVLAAACVGKFTGAFGAARLTGAAPREATALGVLLNARGLTELVILNVGLGLGVIDTRLFTAMVLMAVATTLMTGPLLDRARPPEPPANRSASVDRPVHDAA